MKQIFFSRATASPIGWVTYLLTFVYVCVEFGFNYQLLNISVDFVSDEVLLGLEFWGRILSGVGLSLVLYRSAISQRFPKILRPLNCLILGVSLMWNVQKFLTDYLVNQASLEDKEVSLILATLTSKAADGMLTTQSGNGFFLNETREQDRKIAASLFPAIALYSPNRLEQVAAWSDMSANQIKGLLALNDSESRLSNAYRNLIIPPLTLGISIFYAILNLAQWLGMTLRIFQKRLRISNLQIRLVTSTIFLIFVLYSFIAPSSFANSKAYQEELNQTLFANHLVLAALTNISAYAVPNWYFFSKFCYQYVLGGVQLKRPF